MTLSFEILGLELVRIKLDIDLPDQPEVNVVDKAAKGISNAFFRRMIR
jgi:hypothetical protein